jgi:hypothetical protein
MDIYFPVRPTATTSKPYAAALNESVARAASVAHRYLRADLASSVLASRQ